MTNKGFGEVRIAARLRDAIVTISKNVVDVERPDFKIGAVWAYDDATQMIDVLFAGETSESLVRVRAAANMMPNRAMTDNAPDNNAPCDIVRVAGRPGQYWIVDYVSGDPRHVNDTDMFLIGDPESPSFENGWTNYAGGYAPAGYYRLSGRTYLQGLIKSGTAGLTAFTLGEGFRPAESHIFSGITATVTTSNPNTGTVHTHTIASVAARIDVNAEGQVVINASASNVYVSLAEVSFRALVL